MAKKHLWSSCGRLILALLLTIGSLPLLSNVAGAAGQPDLVVEAIWTTPALPTEGRGYTITARVKNIGDADAFAGWLSDQEAFFYVDGVKVAEAEYDSVAPGTSKDVTSPSLTAPLAGHHIVTARADANNEVTESDEANNENSVTMIVVRPDLIVSSVILDDPWRSWYPIGGKIYATAWIKNQHVGVAGSSKLKYYLGTSDGSNKTYKYIEEGGVGSLNPNATEDDIINFGWTIPGGVAPGDYRVWVLADSSQDVPETDETSNWGSSDSFTVGIVPRHLQVPYYNQDAAGWCWAASLSMILRYYGYDRKPWQIAADFDKGPDDGLSSAEVGKLEDYLENNYFGGIGSSDAWERDWFWSNSNFVSRLQEVLSSGHPVWATSWDREHSIVVTGFDGMGEYDHVYVNDPSGAITGTDMIQHQYTWADFKNVMDTTWFSPIGDVGIVYAKSRQLKGVDSRASLEVLPIHLRFHNVTGGMPHNLVMRWDGVEPYAGYRYEVTGGGMGWYRKDSDALYDHYEHNATEADTLSVWPSYANYASSGETYHLQTVAEIRKAATNELVRSDISGTDAVPARTFVDNPANSRITTSLDGLSGVYKLILRLEGKPDGGAILQELDTCEFYFGVATLWPVEYRWGKPNPGYTWVRKYDILEGWMHVRIENRSSLDAYNVIANLLRWPVNVTVHDGNVTLGNIPAGGSVWSTDTFMLTTDYSNPQSRFEGVYWTIEYDDAYGVHHVVEDVPEFPPGEGPCG